jgi:small subunit ribosomal protein S1
MKQLTKTPWADELMEKYKVGETYKGKVVNITDYGAFIELEPCIEGMAYKSELSWTKNVMPSEVVNLGDEVNVKVLEVVPDKHKISLSIKRCQPNPCEQFATEHPIGSKVTGRIKGIKEFGIFVGLTDVLDGTVAMKDISWEMTYEEELTRTGIGIDSRAKGYEVGQTVDTVVLVVDPTREIIRLGIKQLTDDPYAEALSSIKKDDVVHGKVTKIGTEGMVVTIDNGLPCLLKRIDVGRNDSKKFSDYKEGDEVSALVSIVHQVHRYVQISVNALEAKNQKAVLKRVNSENLNATLGDVLGGVLNKK